MHFDCDKFSGKKFDAAMDLLLEGELICFRGNYLRLDPDGSLHCYRMCSWDFLGGNEDLAQQIFERQKIIFDELKSSTKFADLIAGRQVIFALTESYKDQSNYIILAHLEADKIIWNKNLKK